MAARAWLAARDREGQLHQRLHILNGLHQAPGAIGMLDRAEDLLARDPHRRRYISEDGRPDIVAASRLAGEFQPFAPDRQARTLLLGGTDEGENAIALRRADDGAHPGSRIGRQIRHQGSDAVKRQAQHLVVDRLVQEGTAGRAPMDTGSVMMARSSGGGAVV